MAQKPGFFIIANPCGWRRMTASGGAKKPGFTFRSTSDQVATRPRLFQKPGFFEWKPALPRNPASLSGQLAIRLRQACACSRSRVSLFLWHKKGARCFHLAPLIKKKLKNLVSCLDYLRTFRTNSAAPSAISRSSISEVSAPRMWGADPPAAVLMKQLSSPAPSVTGTIGTP